MGFDLLANPFAVLDLPTTASIEEVAARVRAMGTAEASVAGRMLIVPRTRLDHELRFLLGATEEQARGSLAALRSGGEVDLWSVGPVGRANILAHFAASGRALPEHLRLLSGIQAIVETSAPEEVAAARQKAKLPVGSPETLSTSQVTLRTEHAQALCDALLRLDRGSDLFAELLGSTDASDVARQSFLREAAASWERSKAAELSALLERSEEAEGQLRSNPTSAVTNTLSEIIRNWAGCTRPPRQAARAMALPHGSSAATLQRWRSLAVDLVNDQDAVLEASVITGAIVEAVGDEEEIARQVALEHQGLLKRIELGEGTREIRRLHAALKVAYASLKTIQTGISTKAGWWRDAPPEVLELRDAFIAAATVAVSNQPWFLMRALALHLWNELAAAEAAAGITRLALQQARGRPVADNARARLEEDSKQLGSLILEREVAAAVKDKKWRQVRKLTAKLIPLLTDPIAKKTYQDILRKSQRQVFASWGSSIFLTVIVMAWIAARQDRVQPSYVSATPSSPPAPSSPAALQTPPYAPPPSDTSMAPQKFAEPPQDGSVLSLPGLRWCVYRNIGTAAAKNRLEQLRQQATDINRFNAAVQFFNGFVDRTNTLCRARSYYIRDNDLLQSQLPSLRSELEANGTNMIDKAYKEVTGPAPPPQGESGLAASVVSGTVGTAGSVPPLPSVSVPPPVAPNMPSVPGSPSTAFSDGQADRRAWELWISTLSGDELAGAQWWASVRSLRRPPSCTTAPNALNATFVDGCRQASLRLALSDKRRLEDIGYRLGWNDP